MREISLSKLRMPSHLTSSKARTSFLFFRELSPPLTTSWFYTNVNSVPEDTLR